MGRFLKLNNDMQIIADKLLENQDLCKLLAYEGNNPLSMPKVRTSDIMNKRLLFSSRIFDVDEVGSYLTVRFAGGKPSKGGYFIHSTFFVDILIHQDARNVIGGQRVNFMADIIEEIMANLDISIGKVSLYDVVEIVSNNASFAGLRLVYRDTDFK